jgi:hypothetical protein
MRGRRANTCSVALFQGTERNKLIYRIFSLVLVLIKT